MSLPPPQTLLRGPCPRLFFWKTFGVKLENKSCYTKILINLLSLQTCENWTQMHSSSCRFIWDINLLLNVDFTECFYSLLHVLLDITKSNQNSIYFLLNLSCVISTQGYEPTFVALVPVKIRTYTRVAFEIKHNNLDIDIQINLLDIEGGRWSQKTVPYQSQMINQQSARSKAFPIFLDQRS